MWDAWDFVLDECLCQLPTIMKDESKYVKSSFFRDQIIALRVWLTCDHTDENPPDQLLILLRLLLCREYRVEALELLSQILMVGPWVVKVISAAGFFPILMRLVQNHLSADNKIIIVNH